MDVACAAVDHSIVRHARFLEFGAFEGEIDDGVGAPGTRHAHPHFSAGNSPEEFCHFLHSFAGCIGGVHADNPVARAHAAFGCRRVFHRRGDERGAVALHYHRSDAAVFAGGHLLEGLLLFRIVVLGIGVHCGEKRSDGFLEAAVGIDGIHVVKFQLLDDAVECDEIPGHGVVFALSGSCGEYRDNDGCNCGNRYR